MLPTWCRAQGLKPKSRVINIAGTLSLPSSWRIVLPLLPQTKYTITPLRTAGNPSKQQLRRRWARRQRSHTSSPAAEPFSGYTDCWWRVSAGRRADALTGLYQISNTMTPPRTRRHKLAWLAWYSQSSAANILMTASEWKPSGRSYFYAHAVHTRRLVVLTRFKWWLMQAQIFQSKWNKKSHKARKSESLCKLWISTVTLGSVWPGLTEQIFDFLPAAQAWTWTEILVHRHVFTAVLGGDLTPKF